MQFIVDSFALNKSDLFSVGVNMLDKEGTEHPLTYYVSKEAIKLEPVDKIPSFYMVNKYGEVYSDTQYILVPYIRFMVADPTDVYVNVVDGLTKTNYSKSPFHPRWIGGNTYGSAVDSDQPNKNAGTNFKRLFDPYLLGTGSGQWDDYTAHGVRNENTKIPKLLGIGEDLVPNEGGFAGAMFMPAGSRYLQARPEAMWPTATTNHFLTQISVANTTTPSARYRYYLSLPEDSTSAVTPYILPPLFTDLFSWYTRRANRTGPPFDEGVDFHQNAISVLTFGVEPA